MRSRSAIGARAAIGGRTALLVLVLVPAAGGAAAQEPAEAPGGRTGRLTLTEAARAALASHPSVGGARAGEAAAAGTLREARGALFPRLSADGSVTLFEEPMIVAPLHGFDPTSPPTFDETLVGGNVSLSWTLFDGGGRGARIRSARQRAVAAAEATGAAGMRLLAEVASAYLEVLTAGGVLGALDSRIAALEAELGRVERLAAEGRAADVEGLRVEASLADARAARVGAASRQETAERALARLIAGDPVETAADRLLRVRLGGALEPSAALRGRRTELAGRAADRSPEIGEARRRLLAAEAEARAARAAWFPELRLTGGAVTYGSGEGDFTTEWWGGVRLSWPLFTGGARGGAVARAEAVAAGAAEETRLAELEVNTAMDRALAAADAAAARAEAFGAAAAHLAEVARIERLAQAEGVGVQTDWLRAEAELAGARASLIESRHEEIAARVEVARLTGELTPEWLARNLEEVE